MKIRIKDNSVRLRLTQTEVQQLHQSGLVETSISFGVLPSSILVYAIEKTTVKEIDASYHANKILIQIPVQLIDHWANTEEVSIRYEKAINDTQTLSILVEKDFKCLTVRPDENEEDMYPHPSTGGHEC